MPRRLRPARTSLRLAAALLIGATALPLLEQAAHSQGAPTAAATPAGTGAPALSVAEARAAATRVLEALRRGDANARYEQFSDELRAMSSPAMVQATMRTQPKLIRYELLSVRSGISTSTVEAELTTSRGTRVLFLVLNAQGRIARYYIDRSDDPTSQVAEQFVRAVSTGTYITAHSFLSPAFQREISPQALQSKWQALQRITGTFVKVGRVVEAESTPDMHLVLVNVQFNRLSDNLYVILDAENQVSGVDFPERPAGPLPVR